MKPIEAIHQIEDHYGTPGRKPLTLNQRQIYLDYLNRYPPDKLQSILNKVMQESRYFPRVADFHDAAKEINEVVEFEKRVPTENCTECGGTGWVYTTVIYRATQRETKGVMPCLCFPRDKYVPRSRQYEDSIPF